MSNELPYSPATYVPYRGTMTCFRDPKNSHRAIDEFATAYTQHVESGKRLLPDDVKVNAYVDRDIPRPTLSSRTANQLPISAKIQQAFGNQFEDSKNTGLTIVTLSNSAFVAAVKAGSPAAEAGIEVGDMIYAAHSYDVSNAAEFAAVAFKVPGPLEVFVYRDGGSNDGKLQFVLYRK